MKAPKNRDRILHASIELFNQSGVVAVTTNHIAESLRISPGNLYFHFRNKEEIIRELFDQMCAATYTVWRPTAGPIEPGMPHELLVRAFEVSWSFRFFHREMYHLRRKDSMLARKWRAHLRKTMRILQTTYGHWVKAGIMKKITEPREMEMISDFVLMTSSSFLQFFESPDRPASKRALKLGVQHIGRFLLPYHTEAHKQNLLQYLNA